MVRLTDADREPLYARLSDHAARGDIELPELERRVALIAEAETHEQAAEAFAGLPPITNGRRSGAAPGAMVRRPRGR